MGNLNKPENLTGCRTNLRDRLMLVLFSISLSGCATTQDSSAAVTDSGCPVFVKSGNQTKALSRARRPATTRYEYTERPVPGIKRASTDASDSDAEAEGQPSNLAIMRRLLQENRQYFQQCYEEAFRRDYKTKERMGVKVRVRPDGSVEKVTVGGASKIDRRLAKCVRLNIGRWRFGPDSKSWETVFPMLFIPSAK